MAVCVKYAIVETNEEEHWEDWYILTMVDSEEKAKEIVRRHEIVQAKMEEEGLM